MSKSYYLAADGGGTKLQTILYDEDLRVIRTGRVAGVNTLFKPVDDVIFQPTELTKGYTTQGASWPLIFA